MQRPHLHNPDGSLRPLTDFWADWTGIHPSHQLVENRNMLDAWAVMDGGECVCMIHGDPVHAVGSTFAGPHEGK